MPDAEPGLRERKRRATRRAIQQAALRIALEDGLGAVTVDEISRRADVSPRTFFNYFPSKEQAILGDDPQLPDDAALRAFVDGGPSGDLLADIGTLLVHSTRELIEERGLIEERQQVLRANPELFSRRMASMKEFQAELQAAVARRLEDADPELAADPEALRRRAGLAAIVALAALRHAWWEWSGSEAGTHLVDELERSFAELGVLVSRSLV
ncbi:TetR/AcrR family transcriptional regulator [Curtobacterium flaccumfaciens pv. betae]|uniref:TetR/AcrR family transcriptional regulator n=1 Tax=Curtobacterium flaccumfaciens TaxID=2035 RepID=UPI001BDF3D6B|nr:TetR family transcriptional regulator [Curtobacterium flaccumfaciens]MBT1605299.1 TetR family transcriptional regulator [Curtobacterium flaccumfaciens pv. betae]MBT1655592.1 TetR family transcriptional regulator [Curtobacterium flaccumfaciens pv. betae]MCS0470477.1 TetR/AcrR family transcriptional regulator [Curtobacterium flaccumfaciens pv. betae]MCS0478654.1 TetR/AcrR family transcriptional regulator [Curtobacterium flaccumfaciens pv. betae]MCS0480489.1 TetR/AcrR family transcriptional re